MGAFTNFIWFSSKTYKWLSNPKGLFPIDNVEKNCKKKYRPNPHAIKLITIRLNNALLAPYITYFGRIEILLPHLYAVQILIVKIMNVGYNLRDKPIGSLD